MVLVLIPWHVCWHTLYLCMFSHVYLSFCAYPFVCVRCYLGVHSVYRCQMMCICVCNTCGWWWYRRKTWKGSCVWWGIPGLNPLMCADIHHVCVCFHVYICHFVHVHLCVCEMLPGLAFCVQVSYDVCAAPVGDGGTGGRPERGAVCDEGFLV